MPARIVRTLIAVTLGLFLFFLLHAAVLSEVEVPLLSSTTMLLKPYLSERLLGMVGRTSADAARAKHVASVRDQDMILSLLDDPIPRRNFSVYAGQPHHNYKDDSGNVYATLLCTREPDLRDPFFAATQSLVWRLLWSEWRGSHPVVVFVCPFIPREQRNILRGQGALVKEIDLLDNIVPADKLPVARWRDQFAKLNMWNETSFRRIAYFDVDALPIANVDDIFDIVPQQTCDKSLLSADDRALIKKNASEGEQFCDYTFAGIDPYGEGEVNGGALFFAPNKLMHEKLIRDAPKITQYDLNKMEQGLLHSKLGFGQDGPFKAHLLPQAYNAVPDYYKSHRDDHREATDGPIKVIHDKMWSTVIGHDRPELNVRWDLDWMSMCRFYDSGVYTYARETGRLKDNLEIFFDGIAASEKKGAEAKTK
ncbi:protein of unknown function [Taphrina deformans PYCC 5710]|uniref:Nucleotide-diphospho-sugar transferase n=1 Tax=Taphrina deformans (strain PYCC 5710 / ATCC 11124 / CBS 356.35 / IMI 108563 / JCM 9778 / NBRC 8474) TaxID=1097556 RepID=R4XE97_TAPDE|nr:protein of unknown function [Taphrina deformans PYCC 5710]|eukprot:CCG84142.1 protein of unknown function [Taphrina deformans PYCC 5710]